MYTTKINVFTSVNHLLTFPSQKFISLKNKLLHMTYIIDKIAVRIVNEAIKKIIMVANLTIFTCINTMYIVHFTETF